VIHRFPLSGRDRRVGGLLLPHTSMQHSRPDRQYSIRREHSGPSSRKEGGAHEPQTVADRSGQLQAEASPGRPQAGRLPGSGPS
jgi:hypothetical protein